MKRDSTAAPIVESGEFPFPLTGGPAESPYLTWLRNHSNYMATRGLLDYLRAASVLVRGVIVNFLIFLPYLLVVAIALSLAHNWMLDHPFRLTLGALALAVAWILIFPALTPLFEIVTYKRSLQTGSESSVIQRDRCERSFGTLLLAVLCVAAIESLPRALVYLHDLIHLQHLGWKGPAAAISAILAFFSSAGKLLSVLGGFKKKAAMVVIGVVGLLVPLIVILYAMDFLVYSLPPSPLVMYSPLIVPLVGVLGIAVAIPLGLWQRTFTRKELFAVLGLLVVASAVVVTVIDASQDDRKMTAARLATLDDKLEGLSEIASQSEDLATRKEITPEVATLLGSIVETNRQLKVVHNLPRQEQLKEQRKDLAGRMMGRGELKSGDGESALQCNYFPQRFDSVATSFTQFWDCLQLDKLQAEWDKPYFTPRLQLVLLGHKLSEQPDENLAPLRRELNRLAHVRFVDQIKAKSSDAVAAKFGEMPGKGLTARLAGKQELAKLLTKEEMLDLVFSPEDPVRKEFVERTHRLASDTAPIGEQPDETARLSLAFFYSTADPQSVIKKERAEKAEAAGERLAQRALDDFDVEYLKVLGFELSDRLATAFLIGKDTKGDIGIEEDIDLDEICRYEARSTAPYHLINVALNLQGSKDPGIRDRQSDFFIFSKRFTGGLRTGYCRSASKRETN